METVEIHIERRGTGRKQQARRLRREGKVPAILYGPKRTTTPIAVGDEEFERKLAHLEGSHLIRLVHDGGASDADLHERMVLLREMQRHPVTGIVLHADFYEVDLTQRLTVSVPLHFVGKAVGVVEGGILQPIQREVQVECLPTEIPDFFEIDVSALHIHEAVHIGDLKLPEGVSALGESTRPLVTVLPPTVEEKPVEAAEAVPVEGAPAEAGAAPAAPAEGAAAGKTAGTGKKGGEG